MLPLLDNPKAFKMDVQKSGSTTLIACACMAFSANFWLQFYYGTQFHGITNFCVHLRKIGYATLGKYLAKSFEIFTLGR